MKDGKSKGTNWLYLIQRERQAPSIGWSVRYISDGDNKGDARRTGEILSAAGLYKAIIQ